MGSSTRTRIDSSWEVGPEEPPGQLYNLEDDPSETNNLYQERPAVVKRLKDLLEQYKRQGHSRPMEGSVAHRQD